MGEYADDLIEKGMLDLRPDSRMRRKSHVFGNKRVKIPEKKIEPRVSDDEFTWWWDSQEWVGSESPYEMAAMR
jgi:hypothetical protein